MMCSVAEMEVAVQPSGSDDVQATLKAATDNSGGCCGGEHPHAAERRRRGRTLEQAIFDAVLEQMSMVGFSGLTMEGVAAGARTGKAALYRRWACKEDLVVDVLNHALPSFDNPPDTGNVRDDIAEVLHRMMAVINGNAGCALLALFGELDREHEFVKTIHARVLRPRKQMMLDVLAKAAARGEIRPDAVTPLVAEAGPALIIHRVLMEGPPVDESFAYAVLDQVVMPLLRPAGQRPATATTG